MKTSGDTNVKVAARCRPFNGELRYLYSNFILRFIGLSVVAHINLSETVRLIINIPNMSTVHLDTYFKYKSLTFTKKMFGSMDFFKVNCDNWCDLHA